METTAGVWQQSGFTFSAADNFQHTQNLWLSCCLTSTETTRLIKDGEKGGKGVWRWGKREIIYLSLHYHHLNDLGARAAMTAILMFH